MYMYGLEEMDGFLKNVDKLGICTYEETCYFCCYIMYALSRCMTHDGSTAD